MIKFLLPVIVGITLLFIATNRFICTPTGIAPEFKEIKKTEISRFNADSLWVSIVAIAENKNNFDIEIEDLLVNIIHQNDTLGYALRKDKWELGSLKSGEIQFNVVMESKKILNLLSIGEDSLKFDLTGSTKADLGLITLPVGVDLDFTIAVKEQLGKLVQSDIDNEKIIRIKSAELKKLSLDKSIVEIEFKIENPYGIEFSVINYPSKIFINDKESGSGNINEVILVHSKENESSGMIKYQLSNTKVFTSLFGSVFSGQLDYRTEGDLLIDILGFNIQFQYKTKGVLVKL
jgi:hypothetical protein